MLDLHYWTTPNGHKITIFLEETGLAYKIIPVDIGKGEQFKADFLAIAPNNRIPALVDHEPAGGGGADRGVRIRCHPDLSRREDRAIPCARPAPARRCRSVAVLADGQSRTDGGSEQSLQQLRGGEDTLRNGPLPQRGQSPLRGPQQAAGRPRLRRRRLLDCGYGDLSVDRALRAPRSEAGGLRARQALVRDHGKAPRSGTRLREGKGGQSKTRRHPHGGGACHPVRPDRRVGRARGRSRRPKRELPTPAWSGRASRR